MPSPRTKIVFVEQFYYPDGWGGAEIPRDLTVHLARNGYDVEVICSTDQYAPVEGDAGPDPTLQGVRIRRIPALFGGDIHRHKLLRQAWFCLVLFPRLLMRRRPSLIVSQTNPPTAVPLVALAARILRCPLLLIAMDVYPEVLEIHGTIRAGGMPSGILTAVFNWAYRAARAVVALGPVMRDRLLAKGVDPERIVEISNWSTGAAGVVRGDANKLRGDWGLRDNFVLLYSGNLGIGHEFETLLQGFARAREQVPSARLVVIGSGSRLQEVRRASEEAGLADVVRFSGFVPSAQLPESMGLADLAVVTLRPGFEGLIVPSKMLGYMSRGIPVLYVGPHSDVDDYLVRFRCGIALRNGDVDGVCRAILDASRDPVGLATMGEDGRIGYEEHLARGKALARYEQLINACLGQDMGKRASWPR